MANRTGVIGWMDAPRLDSALLRLEAAIERAHPGSTTPLQILASVDLVVVLSGGEQPRVRQIVEIDVAEDGYRPRLLFLTGQAPVTTALVPVGLPSFIDELGDVGQNVLADDLRHAVGDTVPLPSQPLEQSTAWEHEELSPPRGVPIPAAQPAPVLDPDLASAPPPGWELDRLGDELLDGQDEGSSPGHAVLAATFGLAPPPTPPGVSPEAGPSFEDALRRAQDRDRELKAELGDEYITSMPDADAEER